MRMEFSAGGIIYRKKGKDFEILLIQNIEDQWSFPKGHIEKAEKPEETAIRESEEETGLTDLVIGDPLEKHDYWFKLQGELIHKFVYLFLIEAHTENEPKPQLEEIKDAKWFSAREAMEIIGYKKQNQPLLQDAYRRLGIVIEAD